MVCALPHIRRFGPEAKFLFLAIASASHCCGYLHLAHGMLGLRVVVHVLMENSAM
jgi:hypothetical protein